MAELIAGTLLVASPRLTDTSFDRGVVLLIAHEGAGSFGLVLNRPLAGAPIEEHVPKWAGLAGEPAVLFSGGPVEQSVAIGLGRAHAGAPAEGFGGWTPVTEHVGLVDLARGPEELGASLDEVRIYSGHAGWAAGQLAGEIAQAAWFVVDSKPADIFPREPESLWREVLRRQRGQLAMFAHFPQDPRAN